MVCVISEKQLSLIKEKAFKEDYYIKLSPIIQRLDRFIAKLEDVVKYNINKKKDGLGKDIFKYGFDVVNKRGDGYHIRIGHEGGGDEGGFFIEITLSGSLIGINRENDISNNVFLELFSTKKSEINGYMQPRKDGSEINYIVRVNHVTLDKKNESYYINYDKNVLYHELVHLLDYIDNKKAIKKYYEGKEIDKQDLHYILRLYKKYDEFAKEIEEIINKIKEENLNLLLDFVINSESHGRFLAVIKHNKKSEDKLIMNLLSDKKTSKLLIEKIITNIKSGFNEKDKGDILDYLALYFVLYGDKNNIFKRKFENLFNEDYKTNLKKELLDIFLSKIKSGFFEKNSINYSDTLPYQQNKEFIDKSLLNHLKYNLKHYKVNTINEIINKSDKSSSDNITSYIFNLSISYPDIIGRLILDNLDDYLEMIKKINRGDNIYEYITSKLFVSLIDRGLLKKIPSKYKNFIESYKNSNDPTVRRYYDYLKKYI
jgi:hypothetical protein